MTTANSTGPVLALDLGQKRVGAAVSDELLITIKRLAPIKRSNWKSLLLVVRGLIEEFDAGTLVIGLPLRLDGTEGDAALEVQSMAVKFAKSLAVPVYLQDERLTSAAAEDELRQAGYRSEEIAKLVDSEAAAIILRDFLGSDAEVERRLVPNNL
jgi:putative holliday junction resolvase